MGALVAAIGSFVLSLALKLWWPELPFMNRVGIVFVACFAIAIVLSLLVPKRTTELRVDIKNIDYSTGTSFNVAAAIIVAILVALYWRFW